MEKYASIFTILIIYLSTFEVSTLSLSLSLSLSSCSIYHPEPGEGKRQGWEFALLLFYKSNEGEESEESDLFPSLFLMSD